MAGAAALHVSVRAVRCGACTGRAKAWSRFKQQQQQRVRWANPSIAHRWPIFLRRLLGVCLRSGSILPGNLLPHAALLDGVAAALFSLAWLGFALCLRLSPFAVPPALPAGQPRLMESALLIFASLARYVMAVLTQYMGTLNGVLQVSGVGVVSAEAVGRRGRACLQACTSQLQQQLDAAPYGGH